ncbi:synapsin II [Pelomyxa schiedti]|nr:synapsin II [Pelomyxa schiedti]
MVKTVLVIECTSHFNWYNIFAGATLANGEPVNVEQTSYQDMSLVSYTNGGVVVHLSKARSPLPGTRQNENRSVKIDFVLLRSVSWSIGNMDSRNLLYGLLHSNIPAMNSLQAAVMCLERPVVWGALKGIQQKLGAANFPLVDQAYYPAQNVMVVPPDYPFVAKVGHAHAGYGKVRINDETQFNDFKSHLALHTDYATCEPFIEWDYDMRIQKIGPYYRAFKRVSPNWKGNTGNSSIVSDADMEPRYKLWADECSKLFGGLDILGLDLLHSKTDDKEYILELNDTAIGLVHVHEDEDMRIMKDLVLVKMNAIWAPTPSTPPPPASASSSSSSSSTSTSAASTTESTTASGTSTSASTSASASSTSPCANPEEQIELLKGQLAAVKREKQELEARVAELTATPAKKKGFLGF